MYTIKGTKKKINGAYGDLIPFGADGQNIDMLSGLNLEKELKLGGDHSVSISKDSTTGNTIVTEEYKKTGDVSYYKVITEIGKNQNNDTVIETEIFWVENSTDNFKKRKTTIISVDQTGATVVSEVLSDTRKGS